MFCLPPLFTAHFCPCPTIQKAIILCTDERKSYGLAFILQCIASGIAFLRAIFAICLACMLKKKKEKPMAKEIVYPPPPVPVVSILAPRQALHGRGLHEGQPYRSLYSPCTSPRTTCKRPHPWILGFR